MNSNSDRRVQKTEAVLKNALIELLKCKNIDKITVTEISDYADIYRGTFYLHYKDIYDLFDNIEYGFLVEFEKYTHIYLDKNKPNVYDFFVKLYDYFFANQIVLQTILTTNHSTLLDKIIKLRYPKCFEEWRDNYISGGKDNFLYLYISISSAFKSLVYFWCENDFDKSPNEMAEITKDILIFYGYKHV